MKNKIVIAIDGPAGAGKSTIAKALAKELEIAYISTGSMYRALALKCINNNLDATDEGVAQQIANSTELDVEYKNGNQLVFLDGQNVTDMLYTDKVSDFASKISVHKVIREKLVEIQRQIAARQSVVMDGRDIGSVVLPNADLKFYLDADVKIRAQRRYEELLSKGTKATYEEVLEDMKERDHRDKTREVSPLIVCDGAIIIDCSNLSIQEVVNKFLTYIKE